MFQNVFDKTKSMSQTFRTHLAICVQSTNMKDIYVYTYFNKCWFSTLEVLFVLTLLSFQLRFFVLFSACLLN